MKKVRAILKRLVEAGVSWERFRCSAAYEAMLMVGGYNKEDGETPIWCFQKESRVRWLLWNLICLWEHKSCILWGHAMTVRDGWANPNSGGENFACERCGCDLGNVIYY